MPQHFARRLTLGVAGAASLAAASTAYQLAGEAGTAAGTRRPAAC